MDGDAAAAPSTARAQPETGTTELTVSFPQTPPTSPAVSPPRSRSVSPPDAITYTQRGPPAPAAARSSEPAEDFSVLAGVADDGSPRVLAESEYHRAVLISHNRRDPAALNATYALIAALRGECDERGQPFSRHCHKQSRRVELWTDKEQLAEKGGQDWNKPILRAMREGVTSVFFLSNAFAGSANCAREVHHAAMKGLRRLPVWLEWLCADDAALQDWLKTRTKGSGLMDPDLRAFKEWRLAADETEFYLGKLQGVPAERRWREYCGAHSHYLGSCPACFARARLWLGWRPQCNLTPSGGG